MQHSPRTSIQRLLAASALVMLGACSTLAAPGVLPGIESNAYTIYDVAEARFVSMEELTGGLMATDVLFFGEFHDDPAAHRAQRDLLMELAEEGRDVVLGLEMFERDVQPVLDDYLRGAIDEEEFRARSRPWPNYATDYRPLVEIARRNGWPVLATNLPQSLATVIAREGLTSLEALPSDQRLNAAAAMECPRDAYWDRFLEAMGGSEESSAHSTQAPAGPMMQRIFEAQCARDETMAEAIAPIVGSDRLLVHVNGAFHSDHYLGIVPRLSRRAPEARILVLAAIPVSDLGNPLLEEYTEQADYLIFTPEYTEG